MRAALISRRHSLVCRDGDWMSSAMLLLIPAGSKKPALNIRRARPSISTFLMGHWRAVLILRCPTGRVGRH